MKFTKVIILAILSIVLVGCGSHKPRARKSTGVVVLEPKPVNLPSVKQASHILKLQRTSKKLNKHRLNYIRKYAPLAVREMHLYKIPASITLAQGLLESANGRSQLALRSNNHFGIKCHKGWRGQRVYHDDDTKRECFRKYTYVATSYRDHSLFLTTRNHYKPLFKLGKRDYKAWAKGLRKAGYATDKKYPKKLIDIIKLYELYKFDKIKKGKYKAAKKTIKKEETFVENRYQVQKGDTLYSLARKFGTTVKRLKKLNKLRENTLTIGQILLLK